MYGKIFVTGGTGSLGKALLETAEKKHWGSRFTVYSRDEVKQAELKNLYPQHRFILGDIRDYHWLELAMRGHDKVIHAAAYKQVPSAEVNSNQAVSVNIDGSLNVLRAAISAGVQRVVGVSTDKSCAPVNCYGATKMIMEKLFQEASTLSKLTQFTLVRYGNVLGSRGSVLPLFMKQAAYDGVITITDAEMTRFWMTLQQAVDLIEAAFKEDDPVVLIPKCKASTMIDLAEAAAPNCEIKYIGIRPGEKVHEKLVHNGESSHTFQDETHFRVYPAFYNVESNLPTGFEYTSDNAPQLNVEQLRVMINESLSFRS